jgi:hypothetical protein
MEKELHQHRRTQARQSGSSYPKIVLNVQVYLSDVGTSDGLRCSPTSETTRAISATPESYKRVPGRTLQLSADSGYHAPAETPKED